jgi:hypothetical protein
VCQLLRQIIKNRYPATLLNRLTVKMLTELVQTKSKNRHPTQIYFRIVFCLQATCLLEAVAYFWIRFLFAYQQEQCLGIQYKLFNSIPFDE